MAGSLFEHIRKNIVKYLVYFFVIIITYGILEYVFFSPHIEGLSEGDKLKMDSRINNKLINSKKDIKKETNKQGSEINKMKKSIIDLEEDVKKIQDEMEKAQDQGEKAKEDALASAPDGLKDLK